MSRTLYLSILMLVAGFPCATDLDARVAQQETGIHAEFSSQFQPVTESDRQELASQPLAALNRLRGKGREDERWIHAHRQTALHLDKLFELLESDSRDIDQLRQFERGLYGLREGLDSPLLLEFRQTLTRYVDFLVVSADPDLRAEYENRLRILDRAVSRIPTPDAMTIARQVEWLIAARQSPGLVKQLQEQFSHPCIVVEINPDFVLPMMGEYKREISQSEFTTNRIVGVPVSGTSHFRATLMPELIENPQHATLRLHVDGTIASPANDSRPDPQRAPLVGNVSVGLKTSGTTTVEGYKDIYWDGSQLVAMTAHIECQTKAELENVAISRNYRFPNRRLAQRVDQQIRKRAREEVKKKSPEANREAARIAEQQISAQLDSQVHELLEQANTELDEYYRAPLVGLGVYPVGSSRSGSETIRLGFRGSNYGGIGAPEPLREKELTGDVEVALHETVCTSLLAGYLKGREVRDVDFKNIHRELRGFVPQALRLSGNRCWSVKLDSHLPLETRFRNERVILKLNIDSLSIEQKTWTFPFSVSARYRVVPELDMPRFERDGDVTVQWLGEKPADAKQEAELQQFIQAKFDAFYAREMHMDGMSAPVGNQWGTAAHMKIVSSESLGGWWRLIFKARDLNQLR